MYIFLLHHTRCEQLENMLSVDVVVAIQCRHCFRAFLHIVDLGRRILQRPHFFLQKFPFHKLFRVEKRTEYEQYNATQVRTQDAQRIASL